MRELRATRLLVDTCVKQLQAAGLIVCGDNGACRYGPASPALDTLCEHLARVYGERPVAIINEIVASPNERLKTFADVFRFSKKDE